MLTINADQYREITACARIYGVPQTEEFLEAVPLFTTPNTCLTLRGPTEVAAHHLIRMAANCSRMMRDLRATITSQEDSC